MGWRPITNAMGSNLSTSKWFIKNSNVLCFCTSFDSQKTNTDTLVSFHIVLCYYDHDINFMNTIITHYINAHNLDMCGKQGQLGIK